jgi:hypothetical protein
VACDCGCGADWGAGEGADWGACEGADSPSELGLATAGIAGCDAAELDFALEAAAE